MFVGCMVAKVVMVTLVSGRNNGHHLDKLEGRWGQITGVKRGCGWEESRDSPRGALPRSWASS